MLGDILHIIFTPTTTLIEDGMKDYIQAEDIGRSEEGCDGYQKACPEDVLGFISKYDDFF